MTRRTEPAGERAVGQTSRVEINLSAIDHNLSVIERVRIRRLSRFAPIRPSAEEPELTHSEGARDMSTFVRGKEWRRHDGMYGDIR